MYIPQRLLAGNLSSVNVTKACRSSLNQSLYQSLDKLTDKCILDYRFLVIGSQSLLFSDCSFDTLQCRRLSEEWIILESVKHTCKSYAAIKLYLISLSVSFLTVCWILIVKRSYGLWMKDAFSSQAMVSTALCLLIFHCLQDDRMYIGFVFQVSYQ